MRVFSWPLAYVAAQTIHMYRIRSIYFVCIVEIKMWVCVIWYVCDCEQYMIIIHICVLMMVTLCPCSYILLYLFVCLTSLQVLKLGGVFSAFSHSHSFCRPAIGTRQCMMVVFVQIAHKTWPADICRKKKRIVIFCFQYICI